MIDNVYGLINDFTTGIVMDNDVNNGYDCVLALATILCSNYVKLVSHHYPLIKWPGGYTQFAHTHTLTHPPRNVLTRFLIG